MATQDIGDERIRAAIDRSADSQRGGSITLVLLVAGTLVGAATGLVLMGRTNGEPYILAVLAILAVVGVFSLFALASGILRLGSKDSGSPLIKAVLDGAFDGVVVTDSGGRVVYANSAYLDLIDASGPNDVRPVERVFIGDAEVSEAVYRLLKAAREGGRLQEEVRVAGLKGRPARWLRLKVRPLGGGKRDARLTVSGRKTCSRNCSTRSIISTTRPRDFSRPMPRAMSSISTPRLPIGSTRTWRRSAPVASSSPTWWRATGHRC
jgi:two-component system cell cycle sensor histidine kinase/response regulator CckA